jgi:uncharacterized cupredoxin-like copper-binding protein
MYLLRFVLLLSIIALAACGSPLPAERELIVVATEMQFTPDRLEARAGAPIFIRLRNDGQLAHNLRIELPYGDRTVSAEPGVDAILALPATGAGEYRFFCSILGHEGQEGILVVAEEP